MARKDFELIAAAVRDQLDAARSDAAAEHARAYLGALARDLAHEFANGNPQFDRTRFLNACGVTEES